MIIFTLGYLLVYALAQVLHKGISNFHFFECGILLTPNEKKMFQVGFEPTITRLAAEVSPYYTTVARDQSHGA